MVSNQREIAESVVRNRDAAVKSSRHTGKSHGASRIVSWWLDTHLDPFVTTTAPDDQTGPMQSFGDISGSTLGIIP
jgi:hypothetical protein